MAVTKEERTFHDIMKCYRNQPQANSQVYRSVLLKYAAEVSVTEYVKKDHDVEMKEYDPVSEAERTLHSMDMRRALKFYLKGTESFRTINRLLVTYGSPGKGYDDCPSSEIKVTDKCSEAIKEERGDLIKFYNSVYVKRVTSFAIKYANTTPDHLMEAPPLSPFPSLKQQPVSPRRISQQHSIYVSPHKNGSCLTPRTALLYKFNGSPSKSLKDINNMIKQGEQKTKKRVIAIDSDTESPAKRPRQENDDVLLKRLQDVISERANH